MLAGAEIGPFSERVCRFANVRNYRAALTALSQQEPDIKETLSSLAESESETVDELIDSIFRERPDLPPRPPTRFSNGRWPVLYASLDWATAQAERTHNIHLDEGSVRLYKISYVLTATRCFDLRPLAETHTFLTEDDEAVAYPPCQALAAEAIDAGGQALITFSARRDAGVNTPSFRRDIVSEAAIEGQVLLHVVGGTVASIEEVSLAS
jgi:RES domain